MGGTIRRGSTEAESRQVLPLGKKLEHGCSFKKALSSPDASGQGPSLIGLGGCPSQLQAENPGVVSDTPR